jgi:hypothetical protein
MSETSEYNEQEMAAYLFPFYAMSDRDGVELTCEKVSAELKEWLDSKIMEMRLKMCNGNVNMEQLNIENDKLFRENKVLLEKIESMKCCGNCGAYSVKHCPKMTIADKCDRWEFHKCEN